MNGISRVASAMVSQQSRLESITANLANANTPGFKRRLNSNHGQLVGRHNARTIGLGISQRNDFAQGALQKTDNELDLAIEGEGFFAVESPEGEVYTRDGELKKTEDGALVTPEGFPVAWEGGGGQLQPTEGVIQVGPDGTVSQGGANVGKLKLVGFDNLARLNHTADGYWRAPNSMVPAEATGSIRQHHLEGSNVDAVSELVAMITVQRHFDQAAQTLTQIDQSYKRLHSR